MLVAFKNVSNDSCLSFHEVNFIDSEVVYINHCATFRVWIQDIDGDLYYCDTMTESDFISVLQFYKSKGFIDFHLYNFDFEGD